MDLKKLYHRKRLTIWRIIAVVLGLLAFSLCIVYSLFGVFFVNSIVGIIGYSSETTKIVSDSDAIVYVGIFVYPLILSLCFLYTFWQGPPSELRRAILYLVIFLVVGPLTYFNYYHADQIIRPGVQFFFNLFVIFVGYIIVLWALNLSPVSRDGTALQSLIILLTSGGMIVLPLFYSAVFLMVIFGWVDEESAKAIGDGTALGISGFSGVVAGLLNLRSSLKSLSS